MNCFVALPRMRNMLAEEVRVMLKAASFATRYEALGLATTSLGGTSAGLREHVY